MCDNLVIIHNRLQHFDVNCFADYPPPPSLLLLPWKPNRNVTLIS